MANASRPSAYLSGKQNVIPSIDRMTEATAEDFKELSDILTNHAGLIDAINRTDEAADFYGFFTSLDLVAAQYPDAPEDSFAVIDPGNGNPQQIATVENGVWTMEELTAPIQFYATKADRPTTGQDGVWYIVKDEKIAYLWYDGKYNGFGKDGANGMSAYEVAVAFGFEGTEQEWLASLVGPEGPEGPAGDGSTSPNEVLIFIAGHQSGLTFQPYSKFVIDGVTDEDSRQVTADNADPTLPRYDVFAIEKATKQIVIIKGTAADPRTYPEVDPLTHLDTGVFIDIPAGATQPAGITKNTIYSEGNEWTVTADASLFDVANTENPKAGTKAIKTLQALQSQASITFEPSAPITLEEGMAIHYNMANIAGGEHQWIVQGNDKNGRLISGGIGDPASYDPSITTYQFLATGNIPTGTRMVDIRKILFVAIDSGMEFYLDEISLSGGSGSVESGVTREFVLAEDAKLQEQLDDHETRIIALEGGSTTSPSGHHENKYADVAAMLADQANQTEGALQFVTDASGWSTVDSGWAEFEKLSTSNAEEADYRKDAEEESMDDKGISSDSGQILTEGSDKKPLLTDTQFNNLVKAIMIHNNHGAGVSTTWDAVNKQVIINVEGATSAPDTTTGLPYGTEINESTTNSYIGSPSIIRLSSGRLISTHDYFMTPLKSSVYYSDDNGQTWAFAQDITGIAWGTLFEYNGDQYLLGVTAYSNGGICISKSTDNGSTWSAPVIIVNSIEGGFATASVNYKIKDGYFVKSIEVQSTTGGWAGFHKAGLLFGNLSDLTNSENWSISNLISFNGIALENAGIAKNASYAKRPGGNNDSKGFLEGNLIEKTDGNLINLLRLEQNPNSNYAVYLDVTWDSVTPPNSTLGSTHNFIEMPGGNVKFHVIYDSVSDKHWTITNVNKYKWFGDNRIESYLLSSSDNCKTWQVHQKVGGFPVTISWESEIPQLASQYATLIINGNDLLVVSRVADSNASSWHDSNLSTFTTIKNFRDSAIETHVNGSLIIDENSQRLEDSNGIAIIHDQSKYYNSPFQLNAQNANKPNWAVDGIQFDGASYLRLMHDRNLSLNYYGGITFFIVIKNIQDVTSALRILSNDDAANQEIASGKGGWWLSAESIGIEQRYAVWNDMTIGNDYIVAVSFDHANNHIYGYLNGVNRGNPGTKSNVTWDTDHLVMNGAYSGTNFGEIRVGNRNIGVSKLNFTSKIKALHVIPSYMNPADTIAYMNNLNAKYDIY